MKKIITIGLCLALLQACGQRDAGSMERGAMPSSTPVAPMMVEADFAGKAASVEAPKPAPADNAEVKKYIALRHHLTVEAAAEKMQAVFNAAVAQCEQLKCQTLNANYNRETPYQPPSASLSVRVPPAAVETFITGLSKDAEVIQHARDSEDKTSQVVDAEARIKNLTEFRNNLRAMLSDKSAKFKDLIEVQRELVNTQSELDSIQSMRKVLALETEMVAVDIQFNAKQGITEQGFLSPVAQALKNAGHVLMQNIADVITFFMIALPWLLIGVPLLMLMRKIWVRIFRK